MLIDPVKINSSNDLPNDQIHCVRQDIYDRLWLASPAGLICYNGNKLEIFDTRSGLECMGLRTIEISSDNIIWIGTDRGIEAMDIEGNKVNLNINFEWIYGIAESIFFYKHQVWVGTSDGLLMLEYDGSKTILVNRIEVGLVKNIIHKADNQHLLDSSIYGLLDFDGTYWKTFNSEISQKETILCLKKTFDNYFLVGTTNGVYVLNSQGEIAHHFNYTENNRTASAISVIGDEWWIAFGNTILQTFPNTYGIQIKNSIELSSRVNDLFADRLNNIWIATNDTGLKKISCLRDIFTKANTKIEGAVYSIKKGLHEGQLNVSGDGFYSILDLTKNEEQTQLVSEFSSVVWNTCIDPVDKEIVWLATQEGLYFSKNKSKPQLFRTANSGTNIPNRVLADRNDEVWLGTISGLFKIKNQGVEEIYQLDNIKFGYVYTICLYQKNKFLIGTLGQGLWLETDKGFKQIINDCISKLGNIYSITSNKIGEVVIVQEENIILLDKNLNAKIIYKEFPLAGWSASWIDNNSIAIGSNSGCIIIDKNATNETIRFSSLLDKSGWQFTSTHSLSAGNDGKLFCGTNGGLFILDSKKLNRFSSPPKPKVSSIKWRNVDPQKVGDRYELPTGKWTVDAEVYSSWFVDEHQVQYRFKLVGFDTNWGSYSSRSFIRYNSLPPGDYELMAQAFAPLTGKGEKISLLNFSVSVPFLSKKTAPVFEHMSTTFYKIFKAKNQNTNLIKQNEELQKEIRERILAEKELQKYKFQLEGMVANRTQALLIEKEKAESASKMKSEFLANMSHEIRTPIGGIIGLNNIMAKTELDEEQIDYVSKIDYSASHLLQVLNDILDITKIEAGKMELEIIPFSINNLLKEIETFGNIKALENNITFKLENHLEQNKVLKGDPLRIKQVLLNLLNNAIKFTEQGTVSLGIKQINQIKESIVIQFEVNDSGIGMTETQVQNLFKAFYQADSSTSRKYGGTGLGLSICFKFIKMMNSELLVKSELGKGSSFYFNLQLETTTAATLNPSAHSLQNKNILIHQSAGIQHGKTENIIPGHDNMDTNSELKGKRILVAEDNKINQLIIRKILTDEGFIIDVVSDGKACIELFEKNPDFDLILMDIQMPEMDGYQATEYIRNELNNADISIIALTAHTLSGTKETVIEKGMNDYLSKPIDRNDLMAMMKKWILK